MFSGTPCQTSGLLSYLQLLKQDISQLYVVDLVCHGVPAPYVWRDYLKYIEKKYHAKITDVNFRDKSQLGWSAHKESFKLGNKYLCVSTYTDLFYKHLMFRHSCGVCHFTNLKRPSDLTIADFGVGKRLINILMPIIKASLYFWSIRKKADNYSLK